MDNATKEAVITQAIEMLATAIPEGLTVEKLGDALLVQGAPSFEHQDVVMQLAADLRARYGMRNGERWYFTSHIQICVGDYQPDIVGWKLAPGERDPVREIAKRLPDWVCEVQSSNRRIDWNVKKPDYDAAGIPWLWMISTANRTVHVYQHQELGYALAELWEPLLEKTRPRRQLPPFTDLHVEFDELFRSIPK